MLRKVPDLFLHAASRRKKFRSRNADRAMLEKLKIHGQIVYELTSAYLEPRKSMYERLAFLAALRDKTAGGYTHEPLAARFPPQRVAEVLETCHLEIFERLLECPLSVLERDLGEYFAAREGAALLAQHSCLELTLSWMPAKAPEYLKALYSSNQAALCELLRGSSTAHSGT